MIETVEKGCIRVHSFLPLTRRAIAHPYDNSIEKQKEHKSQRHIGETVLQVCSVRLLNALNPREGNHNSKDARNLFSIVIIDQLCEITKKKNRNKNSYDRYPIHAR